MRPLPPPLPVACQAEEGVNTDINHVGVLLSPSYLKFDSIVLDMMHAATSATSPVIATISTSATSVATSTSITSALAASKADCSAGGHGLRSVSGGEFSRTTIPDPLQFLGGFLGPLGSRNRNPGVLLEMRGKPSEMSQEE